MKNYSALKYNYNFKKAITKFDSGDEYGRILEECKGRVGQANIRFRKLLIDRGIDQEVTLDELNKAHANVDELRKLLERLFVEYIEYSTMETVLKTLKKKNTSIEDLYNRHHSNKYDRLWGLIA